MNVRTLDEKSRVVVASIGPVGGGGGGTPKHDGPDGSGGLTSFLKNTPVEINEAEVPILFSKYGLQPDTAGPGRFRGGLATVMEFSVSAPNTIVTARNRDRSDFASAGVLGGRSGANSSFTTNPGTATAVEHGNRDVVKCGPGDVVRIIGPGAGGYGLPAERDPQAVLHDWRCGFVSLEHARQDYGVAIVDDSIDEAETARLRSEMPARAEGHFDFGPSRTAFEKVWTPERYEALTVFLAEAPVVWRHFLKHQVFAAVERQENDNVPVSSQMQAIFAALREEFPAIAIGGVPT